MKKASAREALETGADTRTDVTKAPPLRRRSAKASPAYFRLPLLLVEPLFRGLRTLYCYHYKKNLHKGGFFYNGADTRTRTADPLITNQ